MRNRKLLTIYQRLLDAYGAQGWWPAKTRFEVIVGAILTQNTNWKNVEAVMAELERRHLLSPRALAGIKTSELAQLIRKTGYFRQKGKKIKAFLDYFRTYNFDLDSMMCLDKDVLRTQLLQIWGIGPETADAILLYALDKPVFVVDAYTRRTFSRMGLVDYRISYEDLRAFFEQRLPSDLELFKEFHALIDELAKRNCRPKPQCQNCPVVSLCAYRSQTFI